MEDVRTTFFNRTWVVNTMQILSGIATAFTVGAVPSALSVLMLCVTPRQSLWSLMECLSFCVFAAVLCTLWIRRAIKYRNTKRFLLINGITYMLYAIFSVGMIKIGESDFLLYSFLFTHLRWLEVFGLKTKYSIFAANCLMLAGICVCRYFAGRYVAKIQKRMKTGNNDAAEIEVKPAIPTQRGDEVKVLSEEEIHETMQQDQEEAKAVVQQIIESMPDKVWDDGFVKGKGEEVIHVEPENPDRDITEGDFDYAQQVRDDMADSMNYDSGALWNPEIYNGRTEDGKPVLDFDDTVPAPPEQYDEAQPLWSEELYKGREPGNNISYDDDTDNELDARFAIEYEADSLWNAGFHKGRDESNIQEKVLDFDDTVTMPAPEENNMSGYDSDSLWSFVKSESGAAADAPEGGANPNEDYSPDKLWNNISRGRDKKEKI